MVRASQTSRLPSVPPPPGYAAGHRRRRRLLRAVAGERGRVEELRRGESVDEAVAGEVVDTGIAEITRRGQQRLFDRFRSCGRRDAPNERRRGGDVRGGHGRAVKV